LSGVIEITDIKTWALSARMGTREIRVMRGKSVRLSFLPILVVAMVSSSPASAADSPTALQFRGKPVSGYLGGHKDFPSAFVGKHLCEQGATGPSSRNSCVLINADGTGEWENDRGPGVAKPAVPIKWYVIADQAGTLTRVTDANSDTWFVILEFTEPYYSFPAGHMLAFPARHIKTSARRVVIDSKYRNLP
jgi:hypothetical protein